MPIDPYSGFSADHTRTIIDVIKDHRVVDKLKLIAGTEAIDKCVFGSIVWDKKLGRPNGPKMSDHFELLLCHNTEVHDDNIPGPRTIKFEDPIVAKWDDGGDEQAYRVTFIKGGAEPRDYWVEVKFAAGTNWDVSSFRLVPGAQPFTKKLDPVWLQPFQIETTIVVDPWKTAGRLTR